jgi:hypothetical protein
MRYLKMIGNSCLGGRKLNVRFYGLMKGTGDRVTPLRHLFTLPSEITLDQHVLTW